MRSHPDRSRAAHRRYIADKIGRHWLLVFAGYALNLLAVPGSTVRPNLRGWELHAYPRQTSPLPGTAKRVLFKSSLLPQFLVTDCGDDPPP